MKIDLDWEYLYRELEKQLETILEAVARNMDELEERTSKSLRIAEILITCQENTAYVTCVASARRPEFAFELLGPDGLRIPRDFGPSNSHEFPLLLPGEYTVICHTRETAYKKTIVALSSESFRYKSTSELHNER